MLTCTVCTNHPITVAWCGEVQSSSCSALVAFQREGELKADGWGNSQFLPTRMVLDERGDIVDNTFVRHPDIIFALVLLNFVE